jgi:uncharacterized protein YjeT (DUF2065 family)
VNPFAAPELAAAGLLVIAGLPKLVRPADTRRALRSVGWPVPDPVVRLGGMAEAVIGAVAIAVGGRVASALVAVSYVAFSAFVVLALRRGGAVSSCGCIGRPDTPPTRTHVVVTLLLATAAALTAIHGSSGVRELTAIAPGHAVALAGYTALTGWLVWLVLADLPRLRATPS